jgi:chromosome segregation ATPase
MTDTISDLQVILQRLAEATQELDTVTTAISQLEQEIQEFETTHRELFDSHRALYMRLANARHIENSLALDVDECQRDIDYYTGESA